jgi:hypothetical protein
LAQVGGDLLIWIHVGQRIKTSRTRARVHQLTIGASPHRAGKLSHGPQAYSLTTGACRPPPCSRVRVRRKTPLCLSFAMLPPKHRLRPFWGVMRVRVREAAMEAILLLRIKRHCGQGQGFIN